MRFGYIHRTKYKSFTCGSLPILPTKMDLDTGLSLVGEGGFIGEKTKDTFSKVTKRSI